ncbi:MAG: hypothetical protein E4H14_04515 [Candidatus Thorarchaeota archaeon]|nr:MAG: hypothetical protein E4H14_04515 [Candidatus Thorarchaeota archaeon]
MTMALLPPSRSSGNLIYLILPFAVGLLITVFSFPRAEWIVISGLVTTVGALILYMTEPEVIYLRKHYRELVMWKKKDNLIANYTAWMNLTNDWKVPEEHIPEYVKTLVGNAVSSGFIDRRTMRLRAYDYFLISYFIYGFAGGVFFYRVAPVLMQVIWGAILASLFVLFLVLVHLRNVRKVFASDLDRDIEYIAEFIFVRLIVTLNHVSVKKQNDGVFIKTMQGELEYLDKLLARDDMHIFVTIWANLRARLTDLQRE